MKSSKREGKRFIDFGKEGGSSFTSFFYFIFKYDCFKFGELVEIRHLTVRFLIPPSC